VSSAADFLRDAAKREAGNEVQISIRELLTHWDAKRRGFWIVEQIQDDLKKAGLSVNDA